jgi:hypothetical protein
MALKSPLSKCTSLDLYVGGPLARFKVDRGLNYMLVGLLQSQSHMGIPPKKGRRKEKQAQYSLHRNKVINHVSTSQRLMWSTIDDVSTTIHAALSATE